MPKIYKKVSLVEASRLMDWAEENSVDWDVWDAVPSLVGQSDSVEIWLEKWPVN